MSQDTEIAAAARRHGLSESAGTALFDALVRGGGSLAQFSHPDLGGMGQWANGMTQIGDMFNNALKAKVNAFCFDIADAARNASASGPRPGQWQSSDGPIETRPTSPWAVPHSDWWPAGLGRPASTGAQNGMRYACFPDERRLAISRDGRVTLYDTGEHRLTGFSQQQGSGGDLAFSSQHGPVTLDSLRVVDL